MAIPLHVQLGNLQYAGWEPKAFARQGLGSRLLADVMIPLPDGLHLSADVYLPKEPGRYPAIVQFSAYNRDLDTIGIPTGSNEIGSPPLSNDRGYVQVVVTARGVGRSEGILQPWLSDEQEEAHVCCIEWAAQQSWCTGDVCLFGTSYYGMNQALAATKRPQGLRAFFANEICTDFYRQVFYYGGLPNLDFFNLWLGANFTDAVIHRYVKPNKRALLSYIFNRPYLYRLLKPHLSKIIDKQKKHRINAQALLYYKKFLTESAYGELSPIGRGPYLDLANVNVPFVVVQNQACVSLHQFGAYDLYLRAGDKELPRWLIVGPAEYKLPVYSWQLEALAFFDYIVYGLNNGYAEQSPVRYWVSGENKFVSSPSFSPPKAQWMRYYLGPATQDNPKDYSLLEESSAHNEVLTFYSIPPGIQTLQGLEAITPQNLIFHFTMKHPITVAGAIRISINFRCNEIDSYLIARLGWIDADKTYHHIGMGHLRPAVHQIDESLSSEFEWVMVVEQSTPLIPNQKVRLQWSLTPAGAAIPENAVLELEIASRSDQFSSSFSDDLVITKAPAPPYFCRNEIICGAESYIEFHGLSFTESTKNEAI